MLRADKETRVLHCFHCLSHRWNFPGLFRLEQKSQRSNDRQSKCRSTATCGQVTQHGRRAGRSRGESDHRGFTRSEVLSLDERGDRASITDARSSGRSLEPPQGRICGIIAGKDFIKNLARH